MNPIKSLTLTWILFFSINSYAVDAGLCLATLSNEKISVSVEMVTSSKALFELGSQLARAMEEARNLNDVNLNPQIGMTAAQAFSNSLVITEFVQLVSMGYFDKQPDVAKEIFNLMTVSLKIFYDNNSIILKTLSSKIDSMKTPAVEKLKKDVAFHITHINNLIESCKQ